MSDKHNRPDLERAQAEAEDPRTREQAWLQQARESARTEDGVTPLLEQLCSGHVQGRDE